MVLKNLAKIWREVFSKKRYVITSLAVAIAFYEINVLISNWSNLRNFYPILGFFGSLKFFFNLSVGFVNLLKLHSFISLIIISVLLGILSSLIYYKTRLLKTKSEKSSKFFGGVGVFLGIFAPGCAACGLGLASALGIGGALLSFFPYDGLELSILSIIVLGTTIIKVTKEMYVCKIK